MTDDVNDLGEITTLPALTARAACRWGGRDALIFDETGVRISFAELERASNAVASRLLREGIGAGDRVAVMLRNHPAFPLTWLALSKIGAAMVPLNVNYRLVDARHVLEHSDPVAVIAAPEFEPLLSEAAEGKAPRFFTTDSGARDLMDSSAPPLSLPAVGPHTLVNIQYMSGTTGHPKGCMLPQGYWIFLARQILHDIVALDETDIMLTAQPFYYMDPQWNLATALMTGATLVVLDGFHPATFWSKVREHNVTFFYCVGAMPTLMLKMPSTADDADHRVRRIMSSAIPPKLHGALERRWGVPWVEAFGMTESGGGLCVPAHEHDLLVGSGSIGRPMFGRDADVVDEHDGFAGPGQVGELVLRGPWMMQGYFRDPAATADGLRNGWLHTGDLVRRDEDGRFHYVARKKDVIRRSGENIAAAEVEDVIQSHPSVYAAACLAEPDDLRGEEVKAIVVQAEDADGVSPSELIEHCRRQLAAFKVPRYWLIRKEDLPRTPSERVAKNELVGQLASGRDRVFDRNGNA